jgi:hypothetical protein
MTSILGSGDHPSNPWALIVRAIFLLAGICGFLMTGYLRFGAFQGYLNLLVPLAGFEAWGVAWFHGVERMMAVAPWLKGLERVAEMGLVLAAFLSGKDKRMGLRIGLAIYGVSVLLLLVDVVKFGVEMSFRIAPDHLVAILVQVIFIGLIFPALRTPSAQKGDPS